ncbi:hypothetical protein [Burkholderia phage vB_BpP_HN04]|uniref:Uncharacterized protein n=1 Tax=Burkholderia phage vB_BpP_HN02 TaxID=3116925 RepID=A0AAX4JHT0_9CAUD|nr:hypothetical protein [Burkholderia phage vB_BpP_HN01]
MKMRQVDDFGNEFWPILHKWAYYTGRWYYVTVKNNLMW